MDIETFDIREMDQILPQTLQDVDFLDPDFGVSEFNEIDKCMYQQELGDDKPERPGGSRFKCLSTTDLQEMEERRQSKSTKRNTTWGLKIFQDWNLEVHGEMVDFRALTPTKLDQLLRQFYAEASPKHAQKRSDAMGPPGAEYHKNTLRNIRAAINRHLQDIGFDCDIVKDKDFRLSNNMLDAKLKANREQGLSRPTLHKAAISQYDLQKISAYLNIDYPNLEILRYKVWFDVSIHFVSSRGLEFYSQLTPTSFNFQFDELNNEFATLTHEMEEKTRQGGLEPEEFPKRMYATNDPVACPVSSLKLLLAKTDPQASSLFNQFNKAAIQSPDNEAIWYIARPVKQYQFSKFFADISKNASCSRQYTSHCLRATAIQMLSETGVELYRIMYMSGHSQGSSVEQKPARSNLLVPRPIAPKHVQTWTATQPFQIQVVSALSSTMSTPVSNTGSSNRFQKP